MRAGTSTALLSAACGLLLVACGPTADGGGPDGGAGADAGTAALGDACEDHDECLSGACNVGTEDARCVEPCEGPEDCPVEGTRCYDLGETGVCLYPLDDRSPGEACESPRECESGLCVEGGAGAPGSVCVSGCEVTGDCASDTRCVELRNGQRGCVGLLEDGEACTTPDVCRSGRCIEDTDGSRLCTRGCPAYDCDEGWACVLSTAGDRICMPLTDDKAPGEACESARECTGGFCVGFGEAGTLCTYPCEPGGCADDEACWTVDEHDDVCGPQP